MTAADVTISPLTPSLGAEIGGVDLSQPLSNSQREAVHAAFLKHKVILFRDQTLDAGQLEAAGRIFGEPFRIPFVTPMPGHPGIIEIIKEASEVGGFNFGGRWHADTTFLEEPALGAVLHGVDIPPVGGDTMFADMNAAYESLSEGLKATLSGLQAVHSATRSYGSQVDLRDNRNNTESMEIDIGSDGDGEVVHPVVRTHPVTGEKVLFVNPLFTIRFDGMTADESTPLLGYLYEHAIRPELTCRVRWTTGTVVVWDNRQTMHKALNDYDGHRRHMRRVTLAGDRPR